MDEKKIRDQWLKWALKRSSLSCSWKLPLFVVGRMMVPFRKVGDARAGGDGEEEEIMWSEGHS